MYNYLHKTNVLSKITLNGSLPNQQAKFTTAFVERGSKLTNGVDTASQFFPKTFVHWSRWNGGKLATGVKNVGGKFATGVNETGCKFPAGVSDTGSH